MTRKVIGWLSDLMPEIKRTNDPEGTMLKFARENNLEPALLEHMAQKFNTAKALNFLEKSANRGDSFHVVDSDKLVKDYTAARPKAAANSDWYPSGHAKAASDVQGLSAFPRPEAHICVVEEVKAASAPAAAGPSAAECEEFEQLRWELNEDLQEKIARLAVRVGSILDFDFARNEADLLLLHGDFIKPACDRVAKAVLDSGYTRGVAVKRASDKGKRRLVDDEHDVHADFVAVQELMEKVSAANFLAKEYVKSSTTWKTRPPGEARAELDQRLDYDGPDSQAKNSPTFKADQKAKSDALRADEKSRKDKLDAEAQADAKFRTSLQMTPERLQYDRERAGKPTGDKKEKSTPFNWDALVKNRPERPHIRNLFANALLEVKPTKNHEQEKLDQNYHDMLAKTVVERLIAHDPVISQHDPAMAVSLAHSIRRLAPDQASDINIMRWKLREALAHGGIPDQTVRDLASVHKTEVESRGKETEQNRDRYGISELKYLKP